jgi:DNA-binding NtrC family response regulator
LQDTIGVLARERGFCDLVGESGRFLWGRVTPGQVPGFSIGIRRVRVLQQKPSVLIVDQSEDSREVLRFALARRGVSTFEATHGNEALELARQYQPKVVVVDLEGDPAAEEALCKQFAVQSRWPPVVMLGRVHCPAVRAGAENNSPQFFRKPYHYGPLLRRIEELLE